MNEITDQDVPIPVKCDVCGRQDETVRFVVYPYVFSILVVTFQRAFSGCWCRFHRIQRWLAASLITSIFGWLGIPFGILITPVRLLQLARGGLQDGNLNGRILRLIGEEKHRSGDVAGAIRCLEASLLYLDDAEVNEKLRGLYRSQSQNSEAFSPGLVQFFAFSTIPVVVSVVGIFVGLTDFFVRWVASSLLSEFPLYLVILLQAPFVILVYFCVVLFNYAFQITLRSSRTYSMLFLYAVGIVTALLFINSIVSGGTYGIYISYFINGFREQVDEALSTILAILTRGGFYIFSPAALSSNFDTNMLFAVLLILSFVFSLLILIPSFRSYSAQQIRIANLKNPNSQYEHSFPLTGWVGLLGVVLVFGLLFVAAPQKSSIDALEAFDHTSQAISDTNLGDLEKAIQEYDLAVELKPNFPFPYIGLGYAYYYSGNLTLAQENFENALKLSPQSLDANNGLGWVFLQSENYELAEKKFQETLQVNPQSVDAHLGLGWIYLNDFNIKDSREQFEAALAIAPDSAEAYFGLGTIYFALSDYENAIASWKKTLDLNPKYVTAYSYMGAVYFRQDKYSEAEKAYEAALKLQPDYYDAIIGLGQIKISNYEYDKGLELYEKAIALDPDKADASLDKASALIEMGKFKEAAAIIESLEEKSEYKLPALAYVYYELNRKGDADKILQQAIDRANQKQGLEQARSFVAIAATHSSTYKFTEAKKYLELAKTAYPIAPDADFYLTYSYVLSAMGEFDEAEAALQQAAQIGHSGITLSIAKANLSIDQEDLPGAEKEIRAAIQKNEDSASLHALLAFVYFQNHTLTLSVNEARRAIQLNPNNSYAHLQLAFAFQASARTDEALKAAKEAARLNPLENNTHYILGVCYMEKGLNDLAIVEFEKFLANYWDRAYIREYKVKAEEYLAQLKP